MERHAFDWPSVIAGIAFTATGIGFLLGNLRWESIEPAAAWAAITVLVGLLVSASAIQRVLRTPVVEPTAAPAEQSLPTE